MEGEMKGRCVEGSDEEGGGDDIYGGMDFVL